MQYTLFGNFISPYSYMIYATLRYKQLDFDYKHVDLAKQEQKTVEYLKMNPMGQVPLLVTPDNQSIFESNAIFEYLEDTSNTNNLLAKDAYNRSVVRTLCCILSGSLIPVGRNLFIDRLGRISLSSEQREGYQNQVVDKCKVLEQLITKHQDILNTDNPFMYLFYQAWYNLCLGYPEIRILCPVLENYHIKSNTTPTIQTLESLEEVKGLRNRLYVNHK